MNYQWDLNICKTSNCKFLSESIVESETFFCCESNGKQQIHIASEYINKPIEHNTTFFPEKNCPFYLEAILNKEKMTKPVSENNNFSELEIALYPELNKNPEPIINEEIDPELKSLFLEENIFSQEPNSSPEDISIEIEKQLI